MLYRFFLVLFLLTGTSFLSANPYSSVSEGQFTEWKPKMLDLVSVFLPKNPIILQAGGHYGNEAIRFAQKWPDGKVISFEPNPHAYEILASKVKNFNNIRSFNTALYHDSGLAPFYLCYGTTGKESSFEHASSLLKPSPEMEVHYQGPVIEVECVVLDQWCRENQIDHFDFMSLDLQGAELMVLKSSPEILKTVNCIAVHTNLYPFRVGTTRYPDLKKSLEDSGFQLLTHWYRDGLDGEAIFIKKDYFFNNETGQFLNTHQIDRSYKRYFEPFFKTLYDISDSHLDTIKRTLQQGLAYEGNIGIIIKDLVRKGSLAVDIGAHIGVHTITMSRKAGPRGGVIAFEPKKRLYLELLNNLKINKCNNVVPISKALSDCYDRVLLNHIRIVQDTGEQPYEDAEVIETMPLDSLNLNNVSLIKMDIENYEYFALKGAKETILRNKPIIIFECWIKPDYDSSRPERKENFNRVISLIESYGYEIYVIYGNDFIAFPTEVKGKRSRYKNKFIKLDMDNFDLGVK